MHDALDLAIRKRTGQSTGVPATKVLVIVDTTALHRDWTMAGTRWGQVWTLVRRGFLELAVPQVVVMEAARQLIEHLDAQEKKLTGVADEVELLLRRLSEVGMHRLGWAHVRDQEPLLDRSEVEASICRRVTEMRGEVLPLPEIDHRTVVARDLDRRKPFQPTGKGYRDALAWLSSLERMRECPSGQRVVMVTDNSGDYLEAGRLAPDLMAEVPAQVRNSGISVKRDLSSLMEDQELADLLAAVLDSDDDWASQYGWGVDSTDPGSQAHVSGEDALVSAAERLTGASVSLRRERGHDLGGLDFDEANLDPDREFWDVEIAGVEADVTTAKWRVYDVNADETMLIEAQIEASIGFVGVMDADYYHYGTPAGYSFVADDPSGRVVRVRREDRLLLHFKAIAEPTSQTVKSIDFDHATRLGVVSA